MPKISFTDVDGNTYQAQKIGNKYWMNENFKALRTPSGKSLLGAYAYDDNAASYGSLYTWEAAIEATPTGWHLPTKEEWGELVNANGGTGVSGGKLKESGTAHWSSPNPGATNESGFSAVPVNYRNYDRYVFGNPGDYASFWSGSEVNAMYTLGTRLNSDSWECKIYESGEKKHLDILYGVFKINKLD